MASDEVVYLLLGLRMSILELVQESVLDVQTVWQYQILKMTERDFLNIKFGVSRHKSHT